MPERAAETPEERTIRRATMAAHAPEMLMRELEAERAAEVTVPGASPSAPKLTLRWEQVHPLDPPLYIDMTLPDGQTVRYRRVR